MKFMAWDVQPFSVVEDKGSKNLMNVCVPGYKLPTRKYFSNTLLPALYEETKTNLKTDLETQALSV